MSHKQQSQKFCFEIKSGIMTIFCLLFCEAVIYGLYSHRSGPVRVVGIATGYGLDGPGNESRWRRDFPRLSRPVLGPIQPPLQWVPGLSPGVKSSRGVTLTPHSLLVPWSRKSRALPLLPLWAERSVQGCTLPFTLTHIEGNMFTVFENSNNGNRV